MVTKPKATKKTKEPAKAPKVKVTKAKKEKITTWPHVVKGTHLTVTTYEDGHTELVWDDEQLAKEVHDAIASVELANMKPAVRAKVAVRKKKEAEKKAVPKITAAKKTKSKK